MHSLAVCLLVVSFIALCCGAPDYFNPLRRRAHHPFRKYPAEENAAAKRCKNGILYFPAGDGWGGEVGESHERGKRGGCLLPFPPEWEETTI